MSATTKVSVNGVDLHYTKVGNGEHAVLLIPGCLGCAKTDFSPQLANLDREKYTIVGWDPRGNGQSRPPDRDYPLDFLYRDADDAAGLMEKLGFSSYSLLGWSDGGNTSTILAAKYPDRVKKVVMWGQNSYFTPKEMQMLKDIRDLSALTDDTKQPMIDYYGESDYERRWHEWLDVNFKMPVDSNGEVDLFRNEVPKVQAETLIIHGMKDMFIGFFHAEYMHKNIKGSRLVCWEEGGHHLHLQFPDRFKKVAEEFLG